MNINFVCFILILSVVAGCAIQKKTKSPVFLQQEETFAKFVDLPDTPFQVQLQSIATSAESPEQLQAFYTISMPQQDLLIFYQQQMERLGWELFAESNTQDWLLHYVKPQQFCSILIAQNHLSIYICHKKGA